MASPYRQRWDETLPQVGKAARVRDRAMLAQSRRYYRYVNKYGITPEEYEAKFLAQQGLCAICHRPERRMKKDGQPFALAVDHRHSDGVVRALLCSTCNAQLAVLESPMRAAYEAYLEEWK